MSYKHKPTVIESLAEKLGVIPDLHADDKTPVAGLPSEGVAMACPPPEKWDSWVEYDSKSWPERKASEYMLIPTACFNCEAGCGLLAYVDKKTMKIRKLVGNPYHPASRGRNCAKGPATLNQVEDQDRVLYPMKRVGSGAVATGSGSAGTAYSTTLPVVCGKLLWKGATMKFPTM